MYTPQISMSVKTTAIFVAAVFLLGNFSSVSSVGTDDGNLSSQLS